MLIQIKLRFIYKYIPSRKLNKKNLKNIKKYSKLILIN